MIIKEIKLNNFTSYYGKHRVRLEKGINYVVGSCLSGRTNLARAIMVALTGHCDFQREWLINHFYLDECREAGKNASCEVEMTVELKEKTYVCTNRVRIDTEGRIKQYSSVPLQVDNITNASTYNCIYIDIMSLLHETEKEKRSENEPSVEYQWRALLGRLVENLQERVKMAILDQTFRLFDPEYRKKAHEYIAEFPMDQIIIIQTEPPDLETSCKTIAVVESRETSAHTSRLYAPREFNTKKQNGDYEKRNAATIEVPAHRTNLETALKMLDQQIKTFHESNNKLTQNMRKMFAAIDNKANPSVYGCILADKTVILTKFVQMKIALQKIASNIGEVQDTAEISNKLASSVEVLKRVQKTVQCPLPEVYAKLKNVEQLLVQTMGDAVESNGEKANDAIAQQNAEEILKRSWKEADAEVQARFSSEYAQLTKVYRKEN